jgi:hypothetical protein
LSPIKKNSTHYAPALFGREYSQNGILYAEIEEVDDALTDYEDGECLAIKVLGIIRRASSSWCCSWCLETDFSLRNIVHHAREMTTDNVQNCDNYISIPLSQTYRSYEEHCFIKLMISKTWYTKKLSHMCIRIEVKTVLYIYFSEISGTDGNLNK